MKEQFVNFKTAVLAKEKGFNIEVNQYWCNEILSDNSQQNVDWNNVAESHISAPTQSLLQRWLREVHNIHICVDINIEDNWYFNIYDLNSKRNSEFDLKLENNKYKSYEQALEIGLQEALKLIK